jgi:hypothetical protein
VNENVVAENQNGFLEAVLNLLLSDLRAIFEDYLSVLGGR